MWPLLIKWGMILGSWGRWLTEGSGTMGEEGKKGEESDRLVHMLARDMENVA